MTYDSVNFRPNTSIGYLLRRAHQLGQAALEPIFAAEALTSTQWSTLAVILSGHCATSVEIARDLAYDKGAMTRVIDQLALRGWVTRERDTADRRHIKIVLTPAGRDITIRCKAQVIAAWNRWLADWNEAETADLIAKLQRLKGTLEREGARA